MSKPRKRRKRAGRRLPPKRGGRSKRRFPISLLAGIFAGVLVLATAAVVLTLRSRIPSFDAPRALADIEALVDIGPRVPGTAPHGAALELLGGRLDSLADQLLLQPVYLRRGDGDTLRGTNLVASFNLQPERNVRVMLGAHWDSRPNADQDPVAGNRGRPVPGANDGASGTAVLLEVARLLRERPPQIGVDILLFDLEDAGADSTVPFAAGSEQFAAANATYRPTFGIIVDMVCDRDLRIPKEAGSVQAARRIVDMVWEAAAHENAGAFLNEVGGPVSDDHLPFLRRGISVIDLIQWPFPDYWHTTADTPDKCSAASLKQVGRVLTRIIYTQ